MKRYQDCNWVVKLFRNRHYISVPFLWIWYRIKGFEVTNDETLQDERIGGREIWSILVGEAQFKMNYYYTMEEVNKMFDFGDDEEEEPDESDWKGID
jgi:hypothetical protein